MNDQLTDLLRAYLAGPRWQVTRDVVAELPDGLDDVVRSLRSDLDLLMDQMTGGKPKTDIDMRIAAEHIVLLLSRLLPLTDSALADLYMTEISEIEGDESRQVRSVQHYAAELRPLIKQLDDVRSRPPSTRVERVRAVLDTCTALAALHATSVKLLNALLTARLDGTTTATSTDTK